MCQCACSSDTPAYILLRQIHLHIYDQIHLHIYYRVGGVHTFEFRHTHILDFGGIGGIILKQLVVYH